MTDFMLEKLGWFSLGLVKFANSIGKKYFVHIYALVHTNITLIYKIKPSYLGSETLNYPFAFNLTKLQLFLLIYLDNMESSQGVRQYF